MVTWVLYLCIGLVIGGMAGFYFAKMDDFSKKQKKALEEKLQQSEQELLDYKDQVTVHFKETATLINGMTESYQKVHEHLSQGVVQLCSNAIEVNKLEVSPNQLLSESTDEPVTEKAESEAPKIEKTENTKNKKENVAENIQVSAASTAATESVDSDSVEIQEPLDAPAEPAVASPDLTPPPDTTPHPDVTPTTVDSDLQQNPPETMAVAEESEEATSESTENDKLGIPSSRMVH